MLQIIHSKHRHSISFSNRTSR